MKLDEVLLDVIHQAYCHYKDDAFGVLKLVHDNTTHSVRSMMRELGVPRLLYLLRDCLASYYILDVVDAIVADEVGFFCEGILNIPPYANDAHKAVQFLKHYEQQKVYTHRQVESLELQGAAILKGVLRAYEPLLSLSANRAVKLSLTYFSCYGCSQRICLYYTVVSYYFSSGHLLKGLNRSL